MTTDSNNNNNEDRLLQAVQNSVRENLQAMDNTKALAETILVAGKSMELAMEKAVETLVIQEQERQTRIELAIRDLSSKIEVLNANVKGVHRAIYLTRLDLMCIDQALRPYGLVHWDEFQADILAIFTDNNAAQPAG